jgi:hypothetical protein
MNGNGLGDPNQMWNRSGFLFRIPIPPATNVLSGSAIVPIALAKTALNNEGAALRAIKLIV